MANKPQIPENYQSRMIGDDLCRLEQLDSEDHVLYTIHVKFIPPTGCVLAKPSDVRKLSPDNLKYALFLSPEGEDYKGVSNNAYVLMYHEKKTKTAEDGTQIVERPDGYNIEYVEGIKYDETVGLFFRKDKSIVSPLSLKRKDGSYVDVLKKGTRLLQDGDIIKIVNQRIRFRDGDEREFFDEFAEKETVSVKSADDDFDSWGDDTTDDILDDTSEERTQDFMSTRMYNSAKKSRHQDPCN